MVELHSVAESAAEPGGQAQVDRDDQAAVFELSPASAEQITTQIRSLMERAWEYIAIAYQGRAHIALGYATWDHYVDDRLGDLRLTVPREQRGAVVQSLSDAQMSLRAIARVLGVSVATAYRDLSSGGSEGPDAGESAPISVKGRDGKEYRNRRKITVPACAICGDIHGAEVDECPWDLFAQGLGPRPEASPGQDDRLPGANGEPERNHRDRPAGPVLVQPVPALSVVEAVTRAVCIIDELAVLPDLVDEIEAAHESHSIVHSHSEMATMIRQLVDNLRFHARLVADMLSRLERITGSK